MLTPEEIAEKVIESEPFAVLTLDDLGLSAEEMMILAIEIDRAQRFI